MLLYAMCITYINSTAFLCNCFIRITATSMLCEKKYLYETVLLITINANSSFSVATVYHINITHHNSIHCHCIHCDNSSCIIVIDHSETAHKG